MTEDHSVRCVNDFIAHAKPPKKRSVVLSLDNNNSHLSTVALDCCKHNGVTVISFSPHCNHTLQLLDVSVYGPLKMYEKLACDVWVTKHPGHTMTIYDISDIVNLSLHVAASPGHIKAGFQVSEIYPFNRDIFHDE